MQPGQDPNAPPVGLLFVPVLQSSYFSISKDSAKWELKHWSKMNGEWCVVVDWNAAYMLPPDENPTRLPENFWQGQTLRYVTKRSQNEETYQRFAEATERAKLLQDEFSRAARKRSLRLP